MVTCNFLAPNGEKSLLYGALEQKYGADRATQLWNWSRSKSFEETLSKIPEITGNAPQLDMNGEPSIAAVEAAIDWNQLTSANIGGRRFKGQMTFEYGGNARPGMGAKSTLQAIRMGERTATTRYEADGHFDYWKQAQVGDIIEFTGADGSVVEVRVTKPFTKLTPDTSAEEWSKKEGWSVEYFEKKVRPKIAKGAWQIEYEYVSKAVSTPVKKGPTGWGRNATTDGMNYEVSTKGDDRFSALKAKLADGRTIEEAYQLDVKGYRVQGNDWKLGKGKKPLVNITPEESWRQYKALWQQWAKENPALIEELREKATGKILTDGFANTDISQARALFEILNQDNTQPVQVNPANYTNHSGGADGADAAWDQIGRKYGFVKHQHYREPGKTSVDSETLRNQGIKAIALDDVTYAEGKAVADQIDGILGEDPNRAYGHYRYRNWGQVKNADAVFAISSGFGTREKAVNKPFMPLDRGTIYAIVGAVLSNKPVYVFDQRANQWYTYNAATKKFEEYAQVPVLTKNFAGVGTRNINENGKKAIEDVYKATLGESIKAPETNQTYISLKSEDFVYTSTEDFIASLEAIYETARANPNRTYLMQWKPTDVIVIQKRRFTGAALVNLLDRVNVPSNVLYTPQMAARMKQLPKRFTADQVPLTPNPLLLDEDSLENLRKAFFVQLRDEAGQPTGEFFTLEKQNEAIDGIIFRFYSLYTKLQADPKLEEKLKGKKLISYIKDLIYSEFATQRDLWAKADRGEIPSRPKSADTAQKVVDFTQILHAFNQRGQANGLWKFAMNKLASMGIKAKEDGSLDTTGPEAMVLADSMDDNEQNIEEQQGLGLKDYSDSSFELDLKDTASTRMKLFLLSTVQSYFSQEEKPREVSFSVSNEGTRTLLGQGLKRELVIRKADLEKKGLSMPSDLPTSLPKNERNRLTMATMPIGGKFKELRITPTRYITAEDVNNAEFRERIKEEEGIDLEVGMVLLRVEPYVQEENILQAERNYLNLPRLADYETLFQDLTGLLANREPSYDGYIKAMAESKNANIHRVMEKLQEAPAHMKKEFVSVFSASYQRMLMVLFKKAKNGHIETRVIDSNRFSEVQTIKRFWQENQKEAEILKKDETGNTVVDRNLVAAMWEELYGADGIYAWKAEPLDFEKFVNSLGSKKGLEAYEKEKERLEKARAAHQQRQRDFFNMLMEVNGIDMAPEAVDYLFKNIGQITKEIKIKSIFGGRTQEGDPIGLVDILVHRLMGAAGDADMAQGDEIHEAYQANNPLYTENTAISLLAKAQLKFTPTIYSQTHKSADGKTIYSFGLNTSLSHAMRKLKDNPGYRERYQESPFAKRSWLLDRLAPNAKLGSFQLDRLQLVYMDGLKNEYGSRDGITRPDMSDREQWTMILGLFQNRNNRWASNYVSLTHSDKTKTPVFMGAPRENYLIKFNELGQLQYSDAVLEKLYDHVFLAEYERMRNPGGENIKGYKEGKQHYYFFPQFNRQQMAEALAQKKIEPHEYKALWNEDGSPQSMENPQFKPTVLKLIRQQLKEMIQHTHDSWESSGILQVGLPGAPEYYGRLLSEAGFISDFVEVMTDVGVTKSEEIWMYPNGEPVPNIEKVKSMLASVDYTINSFLFNTSLSQVFYGDPALHWKGSVSKTMVEYGKRLAKDIAPGRDGEFSHSPVYTAVTVQDYEPFVKELEGIWGKAKVNATDAQEVTTMEEHLNVMYAYGKITESQWAAALQIINNSRGNYYRFPKELESIILQPMKPVAVGLRDAINGVMSIDYVKSSSYPLYPPITNGLELDKLRVAMERDRIDRVNFVSARKLGSSTNLPSLFTADGRIDEKVFEQAGWQTDGRQSMDRSEFRIQQEVPYDEDKDSILTVSQMNKLIVEKIATIRKPFIFNGEELSGTALRNTKEDLRKQLIEKSHAKFLEKIGAEYDADGDKIVFKDRRKLYNLLAKEAGERSGYTMNDVLALKSYYNKQMGDMLAIPLIFTPSASKFEGMMMSLLKKVVQVKMPGHSFVQASPAGFQSIATWEDSNLNENDIVWTKPFEGELKTAHIDSEGKVVPAQILVGFNYFTDSGQRINIQDYIKEENGKKMLDVERLPSELFQLIGARIPNQGHSSMLPIEIVGFLPQNMGDLLIVPAAITKQMGADFDVDKLYTYHRSYAETENTAQQMLVRAYDSEADLLNQYFDVHWSVLTNPEMFDSMMAPLDKKDASDEAALLNDADAQVPYYFSPAYQSRDFQSMKGAKVLVGQTSLALTHNAVMQDKDISLATVKIVDGEPVIVPYHIKMLDLDGNVIEMGALSGYGESTYVDQEGNSFTRTKADNIQLQQSEAVDHAKNRIIDKINLDPNTSAASLAMSRIQTADIGKPGEEFFVPGQALSFDYNTRLLMQPIVRDYSRLISQANDTMSANFTADVKLSVFDMLEQEYVKGYYNAIGKDVEEVTFEETMAFYAELEDINFNPKLLLEAIQMDPKSPEFFKHQLAALRVFQKFDELGSQLVTLQSISSQDTRGAGKDMLTAIGIESKRDKIMNRTPFFIEGAENLFANTETGAIYDATIRTALQVYKDDLPYHNLEQVYKIVQELTGKQDELSDTVKRNVFNAMRAFIFSSSSLGLFEDAYTERLRLLFSTENRPSLARRVLAAKKTWGANNYFLQRLYTNIDPDGISPDMLEYNAAKASRLDDYENIKGWLDLLNSEDPVKRQLGEDLIRYNYVTGGLQNAKNFVKYIPWAAIEGSSIAEGINIQFANLEELTASSAFIEQLFQHNPVMARQITDWEKQVGIQVEEAPESFTLPTYSMDTEDSNPAKSLLVTVTTPEGPVKMYADYISVRENNKMLLYKRLPATSVGSKVINGAYTRIDTLGNSKTGMLEYSASGTGEVRSLYYENRASGIDLSSLNSNNVNPFLHPKFSEIRENAVLKQIGLEQRSGTADQIIHSLEVISKDAQQPSHIRVISGVLSQLKRNPLEISMYMAMGMSQTPLSLDVQPLASIGASAQFSPGTTTISMGEASLLNKHTASENLVHELMHYHTNMIAEAWGGEERWTERGYVEPVKQILRGLRSRMENDPAIKEKLEQLEILRKDALEKLKDRIIASYGASRWNNLTYQDPLYGKLFYGLNSLTEFLPHVVSDPQVISFLNNMKYAGKNISLLDKVKEVFAQLWGAFLQGLGVQKGTYLEEALKRTLDLLMYNQVASTEVLKSTVGDFSLFLPSANITTSKIDSIDRLVGKLKEQRQELIDSYTGVISPKLRADKRMKLDSIDTDIERLQKDRDLNIIPEIGKKHLQWIVKVDKNPKASPNEIMSALRLGRLWEGIIQLMYDGTPSADAELAQLSANASGIIHSLLGKTRDFITEQSDGVIRVEDWKEENLADVSPRAVYVRSLTSAARSRVIQHIAGFVETVSRQEQEEVTRLMIELEKLEKEMLKEAGGKKELKSLYQSMVRKKGWGLTLQYSQEWFDWRKTATSKRNIQLSILDKSDEPEALKSQKKREIWKTFWKDMHDKAVFVNTNIFFDATTGAFKPNLDAAKQTLAAAVGEDHVEIVLARAQRRYMEYIEERNAVFDALDAEVLLGDKTVDEADQEKREYQNRNSPNVFFNNMMNPGSTGSFSAASDKYITLAPKKARTEMWDADYAELMDNPKKKEFYQRYQIIMDRLMSYLPKTTQENAGAGFLPIVRKAVMEDSLNVPEYLSTWQERFVKSMTASEWQIDRDKEAYRSIPIEYIYDNSDIADRSTDLIGIARMFGMMALHYKHFSAAKDEIDMGEAILREIHKARESGSSQMEQNGKVVTVNQGLRNALDALQYLKEHSMQRRPRKLELGLGAKIYSEQKEEGDRRKFSLNPIRQAAITAEIRKLLAERDDLNKRFKEDQEMSPEEYTAAKKVIDDQLAKYEGFELFGSKIGDKLIGINQLKALSYNPFSAVANVTFGMISAAVHATGNVDYGWKEFNAAQKLVLRARGNAELGQKLINTMDRLGVIGDLVDSQVGKAPKVRSNEPKWKKYGSPYAMLRSTDFYMKSVTSLAVMLRKKVKVTVEGVEKEVSLWEALNMEGQWDAEKYGENKSWYSEDVADQKAWDKFRNKVIRVNMIVHGNTDKNSPKLANKYILGRLLGQFRLSWLPEGWYSRFQQQRFDAQLDRDVKGRYRTVVELGLGASLKFYGMELLNLLPGVKLDTTSNTLLPDGRRLSTSEVDIENMRRNFAEMNFLLAITGLIWMLRSLMDDDDEKEQATMLMLNMLIRAQQDIAFYTSPGVFDAVTRNIVPATSVITDYWKFIKATTKLLVDEDYEFEQWLLKMTKAGIPIPQATLINKTKFMMERNLDSFQ